jgi:hypothetical protein
MYQHNPNQPPPQPDTGTLYNPPMTANPLTPRGGPPRRYLVPVVIIIGVAIAAAIGVVLASDGRDQADGGTSAVDILAERVEQLPPIEHAVSACNTTYSEPGGRSDQMHVGDEGRSVSIDGAGLPAGPDIFEVACVLVALDVPDSVLARVDNTRALDGTQTAEWDDYAASWTYHPDAGLNMVIEQH